MNLIGGKEKYCLAAKPVVTEADVKTTTADHSQSGRVQMEMSFSSQAGQRMQETTERLNAESSRLDVPPKMAVVIDGKLVSVATLRSAISDALMIEGEFSWEEAVQIADSLNTGPPPKRIEDIQ